MCTLRDKATGNHMHKLHVSQKSNLQDENSIFKFYVYHNHTLQNFNSYNINKYSTVITRKNTHILMFESSQNLYLTKSPLTICLMFKRWYFLYGNFCFCHMIKCRPVGKTHNVVVISNNVKHYIT